MDTNGSRHHSLAASRGGPVLRPPSTTTATSNGNATNGHSPRSAYLTATDPDAVHDLICVGFGPASLAIAVALHDALEAGRLQTPPSVLFLEKQARFAWHPGMQLPGARMQISFIKDLASLRDPRSHFTFLNYLHVHGRLVNFTNLSTFLPARLEYEDYLRWAARHFDHVVRYGCEVEAVSPAVVTGVSGELQQQPVDAFSVRSRDAVAGVTSTFHARNVIVAIGGQPSIPRGLPARSPRVIHSSEFEHRVRAVLPDPAAPYRVAVVGAGQSAAEIFNNIQEMYPNSKTALIMRSEFLRSSDDSSFINSIFEPSFVDLVNLRLPAARRRLLAEARASNYGVVRLELIEHLYEKMYHQRRQLGPDEAAWPHRIFAGCRVLGADNDVAAVAAGVGGGDRLRIKIGAAEEALAEDEDKEEVVLQTLDVDLVVAATGYRRGAHVDLLRDTWSLLPAIGEQQQQQNGGQRGQKNGSGVGGENGLLAEGDGWIVKTTDGKGGEKRTTTPATTTAASTTARAMEVRRDYGVRFTPGAVAAGAGVWLQGCCEDTHGLSDTLLSVVGTRAGEIVQSIFGKGNP